MMFCKQSPDVCLFYIDNKLAFGTDNIEMVIFDDFDINLIALELYKNCKEIYVIKTFCGLQIFKENNKLFMTWHTPLHGNIPKIFWKLREVFERVKGLSIYE